MFINNVVKVEDIFIREEVFETNFACDLNKCKGACCTFESEYGAPLSEEEVKNIAEILTIVKEYLPQRHIKVIEDDSFFIKKNNELMTNSVNNRECVFVFYEGDVAKCGIEKAFFDGKTNFRKPISCHLFPIRISNFGGDVLRFEKFSGCSSALTNGLKHDVKLVDFCKNSLQRLYGTKWFSKLKEISG
jgi:hypothetical protein